MGFTGFNVSESFAPFLTVPGQLQKVGLIPRRMTPLDAQYRRSVWGRGKSGEMEKSTDKAVICLRDRLSDVSATQIHLFILSHLHLRDHLVCSHLGPLGTRTRWLKTTLNLP
jgi:hypothetical protein